MADLRAKLNCHRDGEDSRITIERQCERRRNIEGCNLEGEFNSLAPAQEVPAAHATCPLAIFWVTGSCRVLSHQQ
jgi:hypothetical protein